MTITEFTLFGGAVRVAGDVQLRSRWHASDGYVIAIGNDGNVTVRLPKHEKCTMFALASGYVTMAKEEPVVSREVATIAKAMEGVAGVYDAVGAPDNGQPVLATAELKRGPGRPRGK